MNDFLQACLEPYKKFFGKKKAQKFEL